MIYFFWKTLLFNNILLLNNWILFFIRNEEVFLGEINIIYCNDEYLLLINNKYLNSNYYTDIITFNYNINKKISGDIFISINRVKENALKLGVSFEKELFRMIIHGLLHLLLHNDKIYISKLKMKNKENFYLDLLFLKVKNVL